MVFLAPELVGGFSLLEVTIGRYFFYGVISLVLASCRKKVLFAKITRSDWLTLCWLALAGNTIYYILLSSAVQLGGVTMTSLVIGFLPVVVTIFGSRDKGAVSLKQLMPSLLFYVV